MEEQYIKKPSLFWEGFYVYKVSHLKDRVLLKLYIGNFLIRFLRLLAAFACFFFFWMLGLS